jgi:REP element-mobilizing transposase RayT
MYPNAWYHVMNRGWHREQVFQSKADYECFIEILHEAVAVYALRLSAYCLMPNHYHLLVQTPDANLDRCMRHINGVYTQRYNSCYGLDGTLFRGRYKALVVAEGDYLLQLVRYIHRNPERAGIVEKAEYYEWSSHKGYLSRAKKWDWLHKRFILSMLAKGPGQRQSRYRAFMGEDEDESFTRIMSLKKVPSILGDSQFIERVKNKFFEQKLHVEVPESKKLAPDVDRIKKVLCQYYNIDENQLYYTKRAFFNEARATGLYLTRQLRGESLTRIGEQFGIDKYSTVSTIIERFKVRLSKDRLLESRVNQVQKAIISQEQT